MLSAAVGERLSPAKLAERVAMGRLETGQLSDKAIRGRTRILSKKIVDSVEVIETCAPHLTSDQIERLRVALAQLEVDPVTSM
jgi:hypothetical protein